MRPLLPIFTVLLLATRLLAQSSAAAKTLAPRVALMDITAEDSSYRSTLAAVNFTVALQAGISSDPGHQWVERAELDKAENELKLAGFGLIDRGEAVRAGRWANADWAVFGRISSNSDRGWTLSLEVVDLLRADVLAETNLTLAPQATAAFRVASVDVSNTAAALRGLLDQADIAFVANRQSISVAMLFLAPNAGNPGAAGLDDDFRRDLDALSNNGAKVRSIRFQRAGVAVDEANLVLSGLVESDPDAWEKVADIYVWGNYAVKTGRHFDPPTHTWLDDQKVDVTLYVWDGKSEPHLIRLGITNETSWPAIAKQLAGVVAPFLTRSPAVPVVEDARRRVAESLVTGAIAAINDCPFNGLGLDYFINQPEGRRYWLEVIQELESACFFDPGNIEARELLLRIRWSRTAAASASNEFFFDRRRSAAWEAYVGQFGFRSVVKKPPAEWWTMESVASDYVLSAWRPFEMFEYAEENRLQWGMPTDVGGNDLTAWQNQFGSEFVSRLLKAPDEPGILGRAPDFLPQSLYVTDPTLRSRVIEKLWPVLIETARSTHQNPLDPRAIPLLRNHFIEIGKPGGEEKMIAEIAAAAKMQASGVPTNNPPVSLPRLAEIEPKLAGDLFAVPAMTFPPPLVDPVTEAILFPQGARIKGVKSILFHNHEVWLAVEVDQPQIIPAANDRIQSDLQPVLVDRVALWKLDLLKPGLEPVPGPLTTNSINSMIFSGDTLWLALDDAGLAALDVKTGALRRYQSSSGVVSSNQYELARTPRGLVATGGMRDLLFLENSAETWTPFEPKLPRQNFYYGGSLMHVAAHENKLLFYNSQLMLCDLQSNAWTCVADRPEADKMGRIASITTDAGGDFWINTSSGLHALDPNTTKVRNLWVPASPLIPNSVPPGVPEMAAKMFLKSNDALVAEIRQKLRLRGQFLDAGKTNGFQPNLFAFAGRLSSQVLAIAPEGDSLWLLLPNSVLLYHPLERNFSGGFSFAQLGTPRAIAAGPGKLWIAFEAGPDIVLRTIETGALQSIPPERRVSDEISPPEVSERLASLPGRERGVYEFFAGHDSAAIGFLQAGNDESLDAQSIFLLALANGESRHSETAEHFKGLLNDRFSDSPFLQVLSWDQRLDDVRAKIKARHQPFEIGGPRSIAPGALRNRQEITGAIMRDFDVNGDGFLDELELTVLFELEPGLVRQLAFDINRAPEEEASAFLARHDMNRNGLLDRNELDSAISSVPFISPPRARLHTNSASSATPNSATK